jgi:hypothetical protein
VKAWHERYADDGLRVIGVHTAGFEPSRSADAVRDAVARLGIEHAVVIDAEREIWDLYGNRGWPARYLFDKTGVLVHFHYGEGGYEETERAIQEQLGVARDVLAPVRPEDDPAAMLVPQTEDQAGPWSGAYEAGSVWAVLEGEGTVRANGEEIRVDHPGAYLLVDHGQHTSGELVLEVGEGVACHAVCFTPGVATD